jgi:hypothetical protein
MCGLAVEVSRPPTPFLPMAKLSLSKWHPAPTPHTTISLSRRKARSSSSSTSHFLSRDPNQNVAPTPGLTLWAAGLAQRLCARLILVAELALQFPSPSPQLTSAAGKGGTCFPFLENEALIMFCSVDVELPSHQNKLNSNAEVWTITQISIFRILI